MLVSVEVPVFHHYFLEETIKSVINQTYKHWKLILLSDGASDEANKLLLKLQNQYSGCNGSIEVRFQENKGIFHARKKLTESSNSDLIIPLDHDDILYPDALADMVNCFKLNKNAGLVRAKRVFIDETSNKLDEADWFPFKKRSIFEGMTTDLYNHSQPYMFKRSDYDKTEGWNGFPEFKGAGGDCDIFLKIEEVADIVLFDKVLYGYRLNDKRSSHDIGLAGAKKMWSMLADITIKRRGLNLIRLNDMPPFKYKIINKNSNNANS